MLSRFCRCVHGRHSTLIFRLLPAATNPIGLSPPRQTVHALHRCTSYNECIHQRPANRSSTTILGKSAGRGVPFQFRSGATKTRLMGDDLDSWCGAFVRSAASLTTSSSTTSRTTSASAAGNSLSKTATCSHRTNSRRKRTSTCCRDGLPTDAGQLIAQTLRGAAAVKTPPPMPEGIFVSIDPLVARMVDYPALRFGTGVSISIGFSHAQPLCSCHLRNSPRREHAIGSISHREQ